MTTATLPTTPRLSMEEQVRRVADAAVDAVADTRTLRAIPADADAPGRRLVLRADMAGGAPHMVLTDGAHRQLADKVGIPFTYYQRMLRDAPSLLSDNLNHWFHQQPGRRMLRLLDRTKIDTPTDDTPDAQYLLRAVLSDRFRPLDHAELLDVVLPQLTEGGATVTEWDLNDERFHLRAVREEVVEARKVGERLRLGVAIRNSETGHAALTVEPYAMVLRCVNGMVVAERLRMTHAGRTHEDDGWLQSDTQRAEDVATFLKVRDRVIEVFQPHMVERIVAQLEAAAGDVTTLDVPMFEFVDRVGKSWKLTDTEASILKEELVAERSVQVTQGLLQTDQPQQVSRWTVAQGVTATARRVGTDSHDFDRKAELERLGWQVLDKPLSSWVRAHRN